MLMGMRGMLAVLIVRQEHTNVLIRNGRLMELQALVGGIELWRAFFQRHGDFQKQCHFVGPRGELPLIVRFDDVDSFATDQGSRERSDVVVLERAQPVVVALIADALGSHLQVGGLPQTGGVAAS
ncbi:MAG: hypothetical protein JW395_1023 [Nitrospira sp.]|nr:hypothetical protein [Nitrospira sp.]